MTDPDEHWYCLDCGRPRLLEDWDEPCVCAQLAYDVLAEQEDQPEREGDGEQHHILEGERHTPLLP